MTEVLAALRVGFFSRQVRHGQGAMSAGRRDFGAVTSVLEELDRSLHGLSGRMNGYQRSTVAELWERLRRSHSSAWRYLLDQPGNGPLPARLISLQDGLWADLRSMLSAVVGSEPRLGAWFDIGDHLADVAGQAFEGRETLPLPAGRWDYVYAGVDRLSARERRIISPFFPKGYDDGPHLACQLIGTYEGLCGLLGHIGDDIMTTPHWDGTTISYRGRNAAVRRQSNGVIGPILDECERQGWSEKCTKPSGLVGDVKQAVYNFNLLGVIRLSQDGDRIRW